MVTIINKIGSYTLSKIGNVYQVENPDGSKIDFTFRANGELYMVYNNHRLNYYNRLR